MMPTISSIRALIVGAARPIHFSGQYHSGKRGLSFSPRVSLQQQLLPVITGTNYALKVECWARFGYGK